jgi:hypothetical protein
MEGRVFACSWKLEGDRYRTWWKARPKVCGEGATFDEADEALYEAIMLVTGDGENQHDYDPPAPASGRLPLLDVDYLEIQSGGGRALVKNAHELFAGGLCPDCRHGRGIRTDVPIELATRESGATLTTRLEEHWVGPWISLYSEQFVAALSKAERDACTWREVSGPPRSRTKYLELVDARHIVPTVILAGLPHKGWRCEVCGYVTDAIYTAGGDRDPLYLVSHADLPPGKQVMIAIGQRAELSLCISRERFTKLRKVKGLAQLRGSPIGVLAEQHVDRSAAPTATWREANKDVLEKRARRAAADAQSG